MTKFYAISNSVAPTIKAQHRHRCRRRHRSVKSQRLNFNYHCCNHKSVNKNAIAVRNKLFKSVYVCIFILGDDNICNVNGSEASFTPSFQIHIYVCIYADQKFQSNYWNLHKPQQLFEDAMNLLILQRERTTTKE